MKRLTILMTIIFSLISLSLASAEAPFKDSNMNSLFRDLSPGGLYSPEDNIINIILGSLSKLKDSTLKADLYSNTDEMKEYKKTLKLAKEFNTLVIVSSPGPSVQIPLIRLSPDNIEFRIMEDRIQIQTKDSAVIGITCLGCKKETMDILVNGKENSYKGYKNILKDQAGLGKMAEINLAFDSKNILVTEFKKDELYDPRRISLKEIFQKEDEIPVAIEVHSTANPAKDSLIFRLPIHSPHEEFGEIREIMYKGIMGAFERVLKKAKKKDLMVLVRRDLPPVEAQLSISLSDQSIKKE